MSDLTDVQVRPKSLQNYVPKRYTRIVLITAIVFIVIIMLGLGVYVVENTPTTVLDFRKGQSVPVSTNKLMVLPLGKGRETVDEIATEKFEATSQFDFSEQIVTGKNVEFVETIDGELVINSQPAELSARNTEIIATSTETTTALEGKHSGDYK